MPITGNTGLTDISSILAGAKKAINDATNQFKRDLADELNGMATDIAANGKLVVQKVRAERQDARAQFDELLGNEHHAQTDDVAGKPQAGEGDPGVKAEAPAADATTETVTIKPDEVGALPPNLLNPAS